MLPVTEFSNNFNYHKVYASYPGLVLQKTEHNGELEAYAKRHIKLMAFCYFH